MPGGFRRWCFTWNNPPTLEAWTLLPQGVTLLVWQAERGEQGTLHLQGYVKTRASVSMGAVKRLLDANEIHLEQARGQEKQCIDYCTKEDTRVEGPWRLGEEVSQGARTDIANMAKLAMDGATDRQLAEADPVCFLRNNRGFAALRSTRPPPHRPNMHTIVLWGPPGTGKSHWWHERFPDAYSVPLSMKGHVQWFTGYNGEKVIVFDDFRGEVHREISEVLHWLDVYPLLVRTNTGMVPAQWELVIFTSNVDPKDWYSAYSPQTDALMRRLTPPMGKIFNIDEPLYLKEQGPMTKEQTEEQDHWWKSITGHQDSNGSPMVPSGGEEEQI